MSEWEFELSIFTTAPRKAALRLDLLRIFTLLVVLSGFAGCSAAPAGDRVVADSISAADADAATQDTNSDGRVMTPDGTHLAPFTDRVVILVEATAEEVERARSGGSAEDVAVIADDLMFYRSAAYEYLERKQLPVARLAGRWPLWFVVAGARRAYNFSDHPTLDVTVLFGPARGPRAIAPVDVHLTDEYFLHKPLP